MSAGDKKEEVNTCCGCFFWLLVLEIIIFIIML